MSERSVRKGNRFRWWNSQRSGFQFGFQPLTSRPNDYTRESGRPVTDHGIMVSPDEYDQPPPSTKHLGGEGEIGTGARDNAESTATPASNLIPVNYLISSSTIPWNQDNVPIYVTGSLTTVILGNNPLSNGIQGLYISIQGVGSSVTINSGNGITFDFINRPSIALGSGGIATLIYNATDSTWHVTSFNAQGGF